MKKGLVVFLTLLLSISFSCAALAAPSAMFTDVPAKHWAYDALKQLAKAGIIEGYGDNTFRGDRTMSRYEMAQIVANAMTKSDKADAENMARIDRLAQEFSIELEKLGARVTKLEDKTKIAWTFENRLRYAGDSNKAVAQTTGLNAGAGTSSFDWRQRVYAKGAINDTTSYGLRLEASGTFGSGSQNFAVKRAYFDVKDFCGMFDNLRVGRFGTYDYTNGLLNGSTNNNDGVIINKKLGDVNFAALVYDVATNSEIQLYNFDYKTGDGLKLNVAYEKTNFSNASGNTTTATSYWPVAGTNGLPGLKTDSIDFGAQYKLGNLWLTGEYVNTKEKSNNNMTRKAYALQISNGVSPYFYPNSIIVNPLKPHTDAFSLSYRSIDPNATPLVSTFNGASPVIAASANAYNSTMAQDNDVKGLFFVYQNVVAKNVVMTIEYQSLKQKSDVASRASDNCWDISWQMYF